MRGRSLWQCSYYASDVYGMGKDKSKFGIWKLVIKSTSLTVFAQNSYRARKQARFNKRPPEKREVSRSSAVRWCFSVCFQ
ncbi:hypothetical protein Pyn_01650 [Prunus yedoensis var. nudiflora]|uniref:Uncharacterized protein n=1 Tax=Prunus yedoensis var. nudiflora TaxID=2094558 RepID=A0A314YHL8_PRUYE|nr:hypothetical protein Pyn_01650 [Prunus yedoensis var. nudiflora]